MIQRQAVISGVVLGAFSVTLVGEVIQVPEGNAAKRTAMPSFTLYLTPYQQHGGHDDEPHRESSGPVRLRYATIVTSTGYLKAPTALSTDAAPDLLYVSVPVTIKDGRFVFGQEQYRSA